MQSLIKAIIRNDIICLSKRNLGSTQNTSFNWSLELPTARQMQMSQRVKNKHSLHMRGRREDLD